MSKNKSGKNKSKSNKDEWGKCANRLYEVHGNKYKACRQVSQRGAVKGFYIANNRQNVLNVRGYHKIAEEANPDLKKISKKLETRLNCVKCGKNLNLRARRSNVGYCQRTLDEGRAEMNKNYLPDNFWDKINFFKERSLKAKAVAKEKRLAKAEKNKQKL